jgi:hypothetical protein
MPNHQLCECGTVPCSSAMDELGGDVIGANAHQIRRIVATARPLGYLDLCYRKRGVARPVAADISTPRSVTDFNSPGDNPVDPAPL